MRPRAQEPTRIDDLFRSRLDNILNMEHELVLLAENVDWNFLDEKVSAFYANEGRPGVPTRLIVGVHILKQMYNLSDEVVCDQWICNPYFQYFCGEEYFQHHFPMDRSSMTNFRKRVGEEFCASLLQESLHTAHKLGCVGNGTNGSCDYRHDSTTQSSDTPYGCKIVLPCDCRAREACQIRRH